MISKYKDVQYVDDYEDVSLAAMDAGMIFLIGENHIPWQIAFACPCGCGHHIQLGVVDGMKHHWSIKIQDDGSITLSPSILSLRGCKSHFFIRNNSIVWA